LKSAACIEPAAGTESFFSAKPPGLEPPPDPDPEPDPDPPPDPEPAPDPEPELDPVPPELDPDVLPPEPAPAVDPPAGGEFGLLAVGGGEELVEVNGELAVPPQAVRKIAEAASKVGTRTGLQRIGAPNYSER